ncbi:BQ5605_C002g01367 [Microbotryum silenes-dioicae]|uniref:BQ5605_C002g01367 protein n=1 Tax=Microbotryum silenes-dioicae TaxID=796604 RepID=A0A2X0MTB8_9BASI|nr:BQ5605_C002g01367 [Microbotryum silenes-dioicae]
MATAQSSIAHVRIPRTLPFVAEAGRSEPTMNPKWLRLNRVDLGRTIEIPSGTSWRCGWSGSEVALHLVGAAASTRWRDRRLSSSWRKGMLSLLDYHRTMRRRRIRSCDSGCVNERSSTSRRELQPRRRGPIRRSAAAMTMHSIRSSLFERGHAQRSRMTRRTQLESRQKVRAIRTSWNGRCS